MINIRLGLFETNSSSTHSIIIMSKGQFSKWKNSYDTDEELYLRINYDELTKPDEVVFKTKEDLINTYKSYFEENPDYLEYRFEDFVHSQDYVSYYDVCVQGEFDDYMLVGITFYDG